MNPWMNQYADVLLRAGVAGTNTSHGAEDNLLKIKRLLEGEPAQTFGMEALLACTGEAASGSSSARRRASTL